MLFFFIGRIGFVNRRSSFKSERRLQIARLAVQAPGCLVMFPGWMDIRPAKQRRMNAVRQWTTRLAWAIGAVALALGPVSASAQERTKAPPRPQSRPRQATISGLRNGPRSESQRTAQA